MGVMVKNKVARFFMDHGVYIFFVAMYIVFVVARQLHGVLRAIRRV